MKATIVLPVIAAVAALVGGTAAFHQQAQVAELTTRTQELQRVRPAPGTRQAPAAPPTRPDDSLSAADKLELLRLRGEVTRLCDRQRELAPVRVENQSLRAQTAAQGTSTGGSRVPLPPGYVRRQDAQAVGQATPEAALQTFFWSLEHRDTNALFQVLTAEGAQGMQNELERHGAEEFWNLLRVVPGYRLVRSEPRSDDEVALHYDFLPGDSAQQMTAIKTEGQWKLRP